MTVIKVKEVTSSVLNEELPKFPFQTHFSLQPLLRLLKENAQKDAEGSSQMLREILKKTEDIPELLEPNLEMEKLTQFNEVFHSLMGTIFPAATFDKDMRAAILPFDFIPFYTTQPFQKAFFESEAYVSLGDFNLDNVVHMKITNAYSEILHRFYNIKCPDKGSMVISVPDKNNGLENHYLMSFNIDFIDVIPTRPIPELSTKEIKFLQQNIFDTALLQKHLPPEYFEFKGFTILELHDITEQIVISSIKDQLLKKDSITSVEHFQILQQKMRDLFSIPDLRLGLAAFNAKEQEVMMAPNVWNSFMSQNIKCNGFQGCVYEKTFEKKEPMVIENLEEYHEKSPIETNMLKEGIKNLLVAPLLNENEVIGMIELASAEVGALNFYALPRLYQVLPIFSLAVKRNLDDLRNELEAIMQREFTAIHPTVAWKFEQAARRMKNKAESGQKVISEPIVFDEVYPLFGQIDIRNSSSERNQAIRDDLTEQLYLIKKVIAAVHKKYAYPIYEELLFRIQTYCAEIKKGLNAGDESSILDFIRQEIEPLLDTFSNDEEKFKQLIEHYRNALDKNLGIVYKRRKSLENSLTKITDTISAYLDEQEILAQKMFPYYCERYKTDGVEYNIYVGKNLVQGREFDLIHLKNLRLWQLQMMAEITKMMEEVKQELEIPLSTTQLILVHGLPLSIRFRQDEKKFDVDGAYNIRYEIVKKRIDKALIKGKNERLTQPQKIAIVYSNDKEIATYQQFIAFLQHKGLLEDELEYLELEDLQGASGLKALRVKVKVKPDIKEDSFSEKVDWKQIEKLMM